VLLDRRLRQAAEAGRGHGIVPTVTLAANRLKSNGFSSQASTRYPAQAP
jgi:hypothetical protein